MCHHGIATNSESCCECINENILTQASNSFEWHKIKRKQRIDRLLEQYIATRSVRIAPLPKTISKEQLVSFMGEFGAFEKSCLCQNSLLIEYYTTEAVDVLFSKSNWLQNEKLCLERFGRKEVDDDKYLDYKALQPTQEAIECSEPIMDMKDPLNYDNCIRHVIKHISKFDEELTTFFKAIQLTDFEIKTKYDVVRDHIEEIFKHEFPQCQLHKFGSTMAGLALKESDLDMHMDIGDIDLHSTCYKSDVLFREFARLFLEKLQKLMYQRPDIFSNIVTIPEARTPIIKFCYVPTNVSCDIAFRNHLGIYKTSFLKFCALYDARVKSLMLLIKYWARQYNITGNGRSGKVSNYGLMCVIIFYLQTVGILPTFTQLQQNCKPLFINGWQVNFNKNYKRNIRNKQSIVDLLQGFFEFVTYNFYVTKDKKYYKVLSLLDGKRYFKHKFDVMDELPNYMNKYKYYVRQDVGERIKIRNPIGIQDPIELSQNAIFSAQVVTLQDFKYKCNNAIYCIENARKKNYKNLLKDLLENCRYCQLPRYYPKLLCVKEKIRVKHFLNIGLPADFDSRTDIFDRQQFKKDNLYYIMFNLLKDILEMIFNFEVSVYMNSLQAPNKIDNINTLSEALVKNLEQIQFSCKGNKRVWHNRLKHNQIFLDTRLSRLEQEAIISDKVTKELSEKDDIKLSCICTVSKALHSDAVIVRLEGKESDPEDEIKQFDTFIYSWIPKIINKTMEYMLQHNKTYSQLYYYRKRQKNFNQVKYRS